MKLKCIQNSSSNLSPNRSKMIGKYLRSRHSICELTVDKDYTIFGIVFWDNAPWFYVEVENQGYPVPLPFDYFEHQKLDIPDGWKMVCRELPAGEIEPSILPEYWSNNPMFYEDLLNREPKALEVFKKLKTELAS